MMFEEETKDEIDPKVAIPPPQTLGQKSLKERRGQLLMMADGKELHDDDESTWRGARR